MRCTACGKELTVWDEGFFRKMVLHEAGPAYGGLLHVGKLSFRDLCLVDLS